MPIDPLLLRAKGLKDELVLVRRDLHRHPELSYKEERTSEKGRAYLAALGCEVQTKIAGTFGVMGTVDSGKPGPTLLIRADMDALPITEDTGLEFSSRNVGVMHACGHDAHVTCALGAAKLLTERKADWRGKVRIVLQPAEELPPGGALPLIEQGQVLNGVDAAVALHVYPTLPAGTVGFRSGQMLAHSDRFIVKIKGRGAHAARPHLSVDSIAVAVQIYQALQYLASRENDPLHPFVLTIGKINGGTAMNVISGEASLEGTTRCLDDKVADELPERMKRIITGICHATRAEGHLEYIRGYPALVNDPAITERARSSAESLLGGDSVRVLDRAEMGGEDFAYFARKVPSTMFRLGVGNMDKGWNNSLHSPLFIMDEEALPIGAATLAKFVMDYSNSGK